MDDENSCPICLNPIGKNNSCITACNHSFCLTCLSISLQSNVSCPLCRDEIVPESREIDDLKYQIMDIKTDFNSLLSIISEKEHYFNKTYKEIMYRFADVEGPLKFRNKSNKGPCMICGCKSEMDDYGDKICYCDSCQKCGCVDKLGAGYHHQKKYERGNRNVKDSYEQDISIIRDQSPAYDF